VKNIKTVAWSVVCLTLSACATQYASNDKQQYLESRNAPALNVPAPLTNANISGFYDLPAPDKAAKVSILPPQAS
jgi:uncharacterized lipoprotein